jgi:hypothetical protein
MAVTGPGECRPAVEIRIRGVLYMRIERCPRWLAHVIFSAAAAAAGWLVARHPWLLTR